MIRPLIAVRLVTFTAAILISQGCFVFHRGSPTRQDAAGQRADSVERAERLAGTRPYSRVITAAATTRAGLFTTHRIGDTLYFEIPRNELNRDMLLVGRFARTGGGRNFGGDEFAEQVLRWERQGNRILLRSVSFEITADSTLPVYQAVSQASYPPVVAIFPVAAYGPDSSAVVDVTRLYTTNVPEFIGIRGNLDEKRSYIEKVASFPDNVEVEATQTATPDARPGNQRGTGPVASVSILAHWSMIRLPERPMMPRLFDRRVGYYSVSQTDFGTPQHRSVTRQYITRWRLEKRFPDSALSEPVRPIVYYVDPATPSQWVPWIKRGIEAWAPAFEAAGFRNAIVAREAPSPAENPDWSPDDVRHSVIRWLPSTAENAEGPHVHDPRTGEILNGSARIFHNVMNLTRNWYFTQVAPLDPRARRFPFPDSLMGRLVQYIVSHEVGHTLGLPHNMKGSSTYPVDSLRSPSFLRRMGHTPTLMDYVRFNYVAQPEDSVPPEDLIPRVGPYDRFAVMWGYRPVSGATSPDAERPALNSWAEMQDTVPWLRYSTSGALDADASDQAEAVGDADPVKATTFGLRNVERVMQLLQGATLKPGEDNSELAELYDRLIEQWSRELEHVVALVGGVDSREKYGGQPGVRFTPISRNRQKAAVRFLNEHAFAAPEYLLDARIVRRIEPEGSLRRITAAQARILAALLDPQRLGRLAEYEAVAVRSVDAYRLSDFLEDVRRGVWHELSSRPVSIDPFRRALQRSYLSIADSRINPAPAFVISASARVSSVAARATTGDAPALMRGELQELDAALRAAAARSSDRATRLHILDSRAQISRILDPRR